VTLQFDHRPEAEVIGSLLRNASGYVIGPRLDGSTAASGIEVVYVLASSTATAGGYTAPPPAYSPPQQVSTPGSPASEISPVGPGPGGQPPAQQPDAPPAPARPAGVSGVAVPVVVLPVTSPPPPSGPGRSGGGGGGR
jgi:hypothetical protein